MQKLECENIRVCLAPAGELLLENPPADYLIAQTDFTKTAEIAELLSNGYRFHDRLFEVAVSDKTLNANINCGDVSRINFRATDTATDEMYKLAYSSFHDDRRFFLDLDFENKEQAREVIGAYIRECMKFGGKIICAEYKNELLGYLLTARLQEREPRDFARYDKAHYARQDDSLPSLCQSRRTLRRLLRQGFKYQYRVA